MRDRIAHTLTHALLWALSLLIPCRRPGRHSAAHLTDMAGELPPATPKATPRRNPWLEPWPTPTPAHIRELYEPLRGEDVALTRPYVLAENTANLRTVCESPRLRGGRRGLPVHVRRSTPLPHGPHPGRDRSPGGPRVTVDSLTAPAPPAHRMHCCGCHRPTAAAIPMRWIHTSSGPGHTLYACPHCAPTLTPDPTPDELGEAT